MSYTINELDMIQDFMIRHNDEIGNNMKSEFETLRRHMTRDLMFTKYIGSNLPRIFNSSKAEYKVRTYNGEITIENPIIAILIADENIKVGNIDFRVVKESRAILLNGNGLEEIECLRAGEDIVFEDMISNPFFKEIAETYKKYTDWKNGKKVDNNSNEIVSTRPAPKPTVEKEVIDSEEVEKAKAELKTSDVNEAFKEIFGEKDENGNYAELNKFEEDLKKAHNLLGTPSVEETVEKQVEEAKEKDENKTSLFGGKPFTFGIENKTDTKPVLKKATKGIKPKFAGFTGTEYMAEDGKVDENGIPLKFAKNTAAEEKFGEPAKDGRTSTNIAELIAPSDLRTIFYLDTEDGTLVNYSNSEEDKQQFKHWTVAKSNPNLIIIGNGDIKKANGEKFTPEEWKMLESNIKEYVDNIDNYKDFIPEDSLEVMEIFLDEDVFHNEEEMYGRVYTDEELKAEDPEELERDSIWGSPRIEGSEL